MFTCFRYKNRDINLIYTILLYYKFHLYIFEANYTHTILYMSLKDKIKARLKAKYSGVNLSTKRLDAIADRLSKKLTEESEDSEIDTVLDEANEVYPFADIAKDDDKIRTLEAKAKDQKPADPPKPDEDSKPAPSGGDLTSSNDVPEWAKALIESNKALQADIATFKSAETGKTRLQRLKEELKASGATDKYIEKAVKNFAKMKFETDDEFEAHVSEEIEDAKGFVQAEAEEGLGGIPRPVTSGGTKTKEASQAEVDSIFGALT